MKSRILYPAALILFSLSSCDPSPSSTPPAIDPSVEDLTLVRLYTPEVATAAENSAHHIALDTFENIYLTGIASGSLTWDGKTLPGKYPGVYVSCINKTGNCLWQNRFSLTNPASAAHMPRVTEIVCNKKGEVFVSFLYSDSMLVDADILPCLFDDRQYNAAIVCLDAANGKVKWHQEYYQEDPGLNGFLRFNLAVDDKDNLVYAANCSSISNKINIIRKGLPKRVLSSPNKSSVIIGLMDKDGVPVWDNVHDISNTNNLGLVFLGDDICLAGGFNGKIKIGSFSLTSPSGQSDLYIARMDKKGTVLSADTWNFSNQDELLTACDDGKGKAYFAIYNNRNASTGTTPTPTAKKLCVSIFSFDKTSSPSTPIAITHLSPETSGSTNIFGLCWNAKRNELCAGGYFIDKVTVGRDTGTTIFTTPSALTDGLVLGFSPELNLTGRALVSGAKGSRYVTDIQARETIWFCGLYIGALDLFFRHAPYLDDSHSNSFLATVYRLSLR